MSNFSWYWQEFWDSTFGAFAFAFLMLCGATAFVLSLVVGIYVWAGPQSCIQTYSAMKLHSRWGFYTGCMVKAEDGSYMPESLYVQSHITDQHTVTVKSDAQ